MCPPVGICRPPRLRATAGSPPRTTAVRVGVLASLGAVLALALAAAADAAAGGPPAFADVTAASGLSTRRGLKYGGPLVADLDGDGTYDLVLPNHVNEPAMIQWGRPGMAAYTAGPRLLPYLEDIHGLSAGDLGAGSGGRHLIVSVGGSFKSGLPPWGLNPRAPVLLQLNGRSLQTVTEARRLHPAKMRGRAPRLVDLDGDGDLDVVLWGSQVLVKWDKTPRQKVLLNGGRAFWPVKESGLGDDSSEGVAMIDINGDGIVDAVTFSKRLRVFIGRGGGRFVDATNTWLSGIPESLWVGTPVWAPINTVAALDYNNDGRLDLYVGVNGTRGSVLLANQGTRFVDVTRQAGLLDGTPLTVGCTVGDFNNDGFVDILPVSFASAVVPVYLNNGDGTFKRLAKTGLANWAPRGRGDGAQAYDADGDGRLDVLLSRGDRDDKPDSVLSTYRLFRNTGGPGMGRSLAVVVGRSPRGGTSTGARVTVTAWQPRAGGPWTRDVGGAGEVFSSSLFDNVHVGVGAVRSVASVRVRWSDGSVVVKRGVQTGGKVRMP
ncbi:hypothetical protein I4F81_002108 [Pyropia yezoensis]|uniref:Uncharacterized protein n=1 Tax=Pyropia yezoensis TaxID=2788 RepID=A0ACC3BPG6_PYRYE|nr:hypothetical protein I4F81_002108 [Neopyropia yezoensis]